LYTCYRSDPFRPRPTYFKKIKICFIIVTMFDLSKVWSSGVPLCVADHSFILITCLLHNVLMLHWEIICWLLGKQRIKRKQASTDVLIKLSSHKVVPHIKINFIFGKTSISNSSALQGDAYVQENFPKRCL